MKWWLRPRRREEVPVPALPAPSPFKQNQLAAAKKPQVAANSRLTANVNGANVKAKTSQELAAVQFAISEPRGYFFADVEAYVDIAVASMQQSEDALRDALQKIDDMTEAQARMQTTLEVLRVTDTVPVVRRDGSYVHVGDADAEVASARAKEEAWKQRATKAESELATLRAYLLTLTG